jgi:predicted ArsR family transcriptional regulator
VAGEILDADGYEPQRQGPTQLRLRNCPFYPLNRRAPDVVCAISHAYLSGLLEGLGATSIQAVSDPEPSTCCVMLTSTPH